jgi:hypothetical protein
MENETNEILEQGDVVEGYQEPVEEITEPTEELPVETTEEKPAEPEKVEKRKLTAQERAQQIREETRHKWEAHRALEAREKAIDEKLARLQKLEGQPSQEKAPRLEDYTEETAQQYLEDLAEWKAEQKFAERSKKQTEEQSKQKEEQEQRNLYSDYEKQYSARVAKDPSFAEKELDVAKMIKMTGAKHIETALLSIENKVDLVEYFGDNLDVLEDLIKLSPQRAFIEIGKITAKQEQKPRTVSRAPAPINTLRNTGAGGIKDLAGMSFDEYANHMNKRTF